jgi:enoyl-CoA hydratase
MKRNGSIATIIINRPDHRNAIDKDTASSLIDMVREFEHDATLKVAVLFGEGGNFCAGADLKAIAEGYPNRLEEDGDAPLGPSRMMLSKPIIAAVSGYAVAGGMELALWCDMRVVEETATFGIFCRQFGVPLIDGGTVRLPRLIGLSRAIDLILTGRAVDAKEAYDIGLANRLVPQGQARAAAELLAQQISNFPQECMLADRRSAYEQHNLSISEALKNEFVGSVKMTKDKIQDGAVKFSKKDY